ncbi:MAG: TonB family protein [Opitutales bacterium]
MLSRPWFFVCLLSVTGLAGLLSAQSEGRLEWITLDPGTSGEIRSENPFFLREISFGTEFQRWELLAGRRFLRDDFNGGQKQVLVSKDLAVRMVGLDDMTSVVGKTITWDGSDAPARIVGLMRDKDEGNDKLRQDRGIIFYPQSFPKLRATVSFPAEAVFSPYSTRPDGVIPWLEIYPVQGEPQRHAGDSYFHFMPEGGFDQRGWERIAGSLAPDPTVGVDGPSPMQQRPVVASRGLIRAVGGWNANPEAFVGARVNLPGEMEPRWIVGVVEVDSDFNGWKPTDRDYLFLPVADPSTVADNPDKRPQAIQPVSPVYPDAARRAGISGTVEVRFLIDPAGLPQRIDVRSGPSALHDAARTAVEKSRWLPGMREGEPVPVYVTIPVAFSLN